MLCYYIPVNGGVYMKDRVVKLTTAALISVACFFTDCKLLVSGNYWIDSKKISAIFAKIEVCMFPVLLALSVYLATRSFDQAKKLKEMGQGSKKSFGYAAGVLGAMVLVLVWLVCYMAIPKDSV